MESQVSNCNLFLHFVVCFLLSICLCITLCSHPLKNLNQFPLFSLYDVSLNPSPSTFIGFPVCPSPSSTVIFPVEGQWLEWGPWSRCSVTCNTGTQQRQRRCSSSVHGWAECKGLHQENRECTNPSCSGKEHVQSCGLSQNLSCEAV